MSFLLILKHPDQKDVLRLPFEEHDIMDIEMFMLDTGWKLIYSNHHQLVPINNQPYKPGGNWMRDETKWPYF